MKMQTPGNEFALLSYTEDAQAIAQVRGNENNPQLYGTVKFYETSYARVLVEAEFFGLPDVGKPGFSAFFGMHIHEVGDCSLPFDKTGGHYNPGNNLHPYHAGDFIPILSNHGYAWVSFFDSRFSIEKILGRSVILHQMRDDFTTQPSGDSGEKIGCGIILRG